MRKLFDDALVALMLMTGLSIGLALAGALMLLVQVLYD